MKRIKGNGFEAIELSLKELLEGGNSGALKKVIEQIANEVVEEDSYKMPIGVVSERMKDEYSAWLKRMKQLEEDIESRKELLERKMKRQLAEEFDELFYKSEKERKKLWAEIKAEMNIDEDDDIDLNINTENGVISQWVERTNENTH